MYVLCMYGFIQRIYSLLSEKGQHGSYVSRIQARSTSAAHSAPVVSHAREGYGKVSCVMSTYNVY
jgi:hypothetical protein